MSVRLLVDICCMSLESGVRTGLLVFEEVHHTWTTSSDLGCWILSFRSRAWLTGDFIENTWQQTVYSLVPGFIANYLQWHTSTTPCQCALWLTNRSVHSVRHWISGLIFEISSYCKDYWAGRWSASREFQVVKRTHTKRSNFTCSRSQTSVHVFFFQNLTSLFLA